MTGLTACLHFGFMMTSPNGNIFRVTGPLCGEFTGHRWIPRTKASDAELWCFLWSALWINGCENNREAGNLRGHRSHYDVIVILGAHDCNECPSILVSTCSMMHYGDVIMGAIASQITGISIVYSFFHVQIKENIKTPRHWPLWGEFTSDRWIPITKAQCRGKCFLLMASSWRVATVILRHWLSCHVTLYIDWNICLDTGDQ